jgi:hypothetical protein
MTDSDDLAPLDARVRELLADPRMWEEPPAGLTDAVAMVVESERSPAELPSRAIHVLPSWARPALLGAAAVVALLFGGVVLFSAVGEGPGGARVAAALAPTGLVDDVDGTAEFTANESGVSIDLDAPDLPLLEGDRFYEAWILTADGFAIPVGTFRTGGDVHLWAGVELVEIRVFTITREDAEIAESPEHRSSGEVVLKATLAGG